MLDYRYQTFLILSIHLNYTKTAQIMNLTQPTITKHIQYLEDTLNTKLFHYSQRRLQLTSQGEKLKQGVIALSEQAEKILSQLDPSRAVNDFRIGVSRTIGEDYIHKHTCFFCQQPNANIELLVENCDTLVSMIHDKLIDFALISGPVEDPEFEKTVFFQDDIVVACSPDHPLANLSIAFARLEDERILLRERGSGIASVLEEHLPKAHKSLDSLHNLSRIGNNHLIKSFIKDNDGIGLFFRISVENEVKEKSISLIDVEDLKISQDFYLVHLKGTKTREDIDRVLKIFEPGQNR